MIAAPFSQHRRQMALLRVVCICATPLALAAPIMVEPYRSPNRFHDVVALDDTAFDPVNAYEAHIDEEGRRLATSTATATGSGTPKKKVAGASGPGQAGLSALRFKLSQSFC